jgi:hypothetical protein
MVIIRFLMKLNSAKISMWFPAYLNDIIEKSEDQIVSAKISMDIPCLYQPLLRPFRK